MKNFLARVQLKIINASNNKNYATKKAENYQNLNFPSRFVLDERKITANEGL